MAPMEGVTDTVFRQIIASCGKPSVFFTEFTNVDGLFSKGKKEVEHRLLFEPMEKPIIAQIWGMKPENYTRAAELVERMGFDGIDINMGCPEKNVVKRGACAGLIHDQSLAAEIIAATREGSKLPISVKTRIGIADIETEKWISFLLEQKLNALIVHPRTAREMSNVPVHWNEIEKIVALKQEISPGTLILGNGDIQNKFEAFEKIKRFDLDGVMIGRGIFHNPFFFDGGKTLEDLSIGERMDLLLRHSVLFEKTWGKDKHFAILRKFYKTYTLGLPNASELRQKFMGTENLDDVRNIVREIIN